MKKIFYCAMLSMLAMACQKNIDRSSSTGQSLNDASLASQSSLTPTAAAGNVYVAGNVLWKNGVATGTPTGASSVYVAANNDVYVVGGSKMWKNNVATNLSGGGNGNSIYVVGNDVYVAGSANGSGAAKIWKNNIATTLPGGTTATSVFVVGSDVYVAGYQDVSNWTRLTIARLWKNGQLVSLSGAVSSPSPSTSSTATAVYVSGSNVYVAGYIGFTPVLWRNGVRSNLTQPNGSAFPQSVFVSGNDVYVAGYAYSSNNDFAVLWRNNVLTTISPTNARALSVFVSGNDIYTAGYILLDNGTDEDGIPQTIFKGVLWKNGVATVLPNSSVAKSVFVR